MRRTVIDTLFLARFFIAWSALVRESEEAGNGDGTESEFIETLRVEALHYSRIRRYSSTEIRILSWSLLFNSVNLYKPYSDLS